MCPATGQGIHGRAVPASVHEGFDSNVPAWGAQTRAVS